MRIGMIGFGRFAQIFSRYLKDRADVFVTNRSDKSVEASKIGVFWCADGDVFNVDYLIISVPISELRGVLMVIKDKIKPGTVVMDVCSVKTFPCSWMKEVLNGPFQLIGSHPMFGPDSAKDSLGGRQIVLCPISIEKKNLDELTELFKSLNLDVIITTPEEHDRQTAKSLALVHFIGRSLIEAGVERQRISTKGFDRLMAMVGDVGNDTWRLFEDMNIFNPYAASARSQFLDKAESLNDDLKRKESSQ